MSRNFNSLRISTLSNCEWIERSHLLWMYLGLAQKPRRQRFVFRLMVRVILQLHAQDDVLNFLNMSRWKKNFYGVTTLLILTVVHNSMHLANFNERQSVSCMCYLERTAYPKGSRSASCFELEGGSWPGNMKFSLADGVFGVIMWRSFFHC